MSALAASGSITVLLGFSEALSAPEVAWSLVDAGFSVIAFARKGRASALRRSRHVRCIDVYPPELDTQGALSDLRSALITSGASLVVFPLDDTAVWLCSQLDLPHGVSLVGPSGHSAHLALNKSLQVDAASRAGFNVPPTRCVNNSGELYYAVREYPVILKAAECVVVQDGRVRGNGIWVCSSLVELQRACAVWDERVPLLVQPFIEGVGEGVFGLATDAGVRAWSGHRRLRMMNPQGSGASACVSVEVPEELKIAAETLIGQTGWRGLFMIELLRDRSGRPWFVELNGRPWGSMALARRQGLEYPAWQIRLAMDSQSSVGTVGVGIPGVVCRHIGREFMHLLFVLRGPRSKALRDWPSIWKTLAAVARVRPGDSLYNWRRDDPKVFVSDCYYTVHDNLFKSRG